MIALEVSAPPEVRSSGSRVRGKAGSGVEDFNPESDKKKTKELQLDLFPV
jgi:hypothetical protein